MKLALSPRAKLDLKEIWSYVFVESTSEVIAARLIDKLSRTIDKLKKSPRMGRSRASDLGLDLRSFPSGNYIILYRIDGATVRVVRVLHGSRDLKKIEP